MGPIDTTISAESKKQSIESARYSSETLMKDSTLGKSIVRTAGGIFGSLILLRSIGGVLNDIKSEKMDSWIFSRVILDFTASGTLIGFAVDRTLIGMIGGLSLGILSLITELFIFKQKKNSI